MPCNIRVGKRRFDLKSITVEPILFLYMYTSNSQYITNQALVYDKTCQKHFNQTICDNLRNDTYKPEEDVVQKDASNWLLYINIIQGVTSVLVVGLFLGPWGDRVGRKIPVIVPLCGAILNTVCNILNSVYMSWPLWGLLVGPALTGMCGGYIAVMMAAYSYVAAVSKEDDRTIRMGIAQSMILFSGTLGSMTSGIMLDKMGYVFVFSLVCGILTAALFYALLWLDNVIPEQTDEQKTSTGCCYAMIVSAVRDIFVCAYRKRKDLHFLNLGILIFTISILQLLTVGEGDILLIFTRHAPFHWSQTTYGLYRGLDRLLRGVAIITVLPVCKRKLGTRDTTLLIIGLVSNTISLTILAVGRTTAFLFVGVATHAVEGFCSTTIRSMCSQKVTADEQGKVFGLIAVLESIIQVAAAALFNSVYKATLDIYTGITFAMAAGISACLVGLALWLRCRLGADEISSQKQTEAYAPRYTQYQPKTADDTVSQ